MARFTMIGTISMPKETEKFHPYDERTSEKGWLMKNLRFNVKCGDSTHMLQIRSGNWADGHGMIYTNKRTAEGKFENIQVPFAERMKESWISEVADNRRFVLDLDYADRRKALKEGAEAIKTGKSFTDDDIAKMGVKSESEIEKAYQDSCSKRTEYIAEVDFVDALKEIIDGGAYTDKTFRIDGDMEYSYNEETQQFYESYVPRTVVLSTEEPKSIGRYKVMYGEDSIDDLSKDELGKVFVKTWHREYLNTQTRKGNYYVPMSVVVLAKDIDEKELTAKLKPFNVTGEKLYEYPIVVDMVNGSERTTITYDDLSDDEKEMVDYGFVSLQECIREHGGTVFGERIREMRYLKPGRGFGRGVQETALTVDDMRVPSLESDDEDSLFDD